MTWTNVRVRIETLDEVGELVRRNAGTAAPLPYAQLVEAALQGLAREARGERFSAADVRAVLEQKIREAKREGYREGVQELARQLVGYDVEATVTPEGQLLFTQPDRAQGGAA